MSSIDNEFDLLSTPGTPDESRRLRFEQFASPSQSPMVKIAEEEDFPRPTLSLSDLPPLSSSSQSKRYSAHFSSPKLPPPQSAGFYSLDNNSSSSVIIPGGNVPGNRNSMTSLKYVPSPSIPMRNRSPVRDLSPQRRRSPSPKKNSPFNFQSTNLSAAPVINSRASHRKGHRYKHSSVSMNLFQEPKPRAPLKVPTAFPIPTRQEFFGSCSSDQKLKLTWSIFHLFIALITYLLGFKYSLHSFSTLSHLMFYDSLSCFVIVFVDIMGNFDVWSKSSIRYPFGLGRIEVLFGFALSVSLIFVGCDLVSHFIEELMFSFFGDSPSTHGHSSNHSHDHETDINMIIYELIILLVVTTTLISSNFITEKTKSTSKQISKLDALKNTIINNPTHLITLIFSCYLALNPLIMNIQSDIEINKIATLIISLLICYMGWKVVRYLGVIILLSFPGTHNSKTSVLRKIKGKIQDLNVFKSSYSIENVVLSKVHMNLVIILVNIKMIGGSDDDEINLTYEINKILNEVFEDKENIETTIDIDRI